MTSLDELKVLSTKPFRKYSDYCRIRPLITNLCAVFWIFSATDLAFQWQIFFFSVICLCDSKYAPRTNKAPAECGPRFHSWIWGTTYIMRVWQKQCLSCKMLLLSLSIRINRLKPHFYASLQSNGPDSLEISKQPLGNYDTENKLFDS